jgi:hypothetical protein
LFGAVLKSSKAIRALDAIDKALSELKSDLDARSSDALPEHASSTRLFYGSPKDRENARERIRKSVES